MYSYIFKKTEKKTEEKKKGKTKLNRKGKTEKKAKRTETKNEKKKGKLVLPCGASAVLFPCATHVQSRGEGHTRLTPGGRHLNNCIGLAGRGLHLAATSKAQSPYIPNRPAKPSPRSREPSRRYILVDLCPSREFALAAATRRRRHRLRS